MWIFKKIHFHTRYDYICICVSFYCNFFNVVLCMLPYPHCAYNKSCKYVSVSGTVHWSVLFGGIRTQSKCLKKSSLLFSIYGIRHRERLWISEYDYCAQRPAISISNWIKSNDKFQWLQLHPSLRWLTATAFQFSHNLFESSCVY